MSQPISLTKGQNINLSKEEPNLKKVTLGLGWEPNMGYGSNFDLDASLFMLDQNEKLIKQSQFVWFRNLRSSCGSVIHSGDNLTGHGAKGDKEQINIDFSKIPSDIYKLRIVINIFMAEKRNQHFGLVKNAFARVFTNQKELCRYSLTEQFTNETFVHIADFYKHNGDWKFKAIGEGSRSDLMKYAISVITPETQVTTYNTSTASSTSNSTSSLGQRIGKFISELFS